MDSGAELPGLGGSLAVSLVSLGVVCLIAYSFLRLLNRRGFGRGAGPIKVLARCPLEPRRALYLVEAVGRCFLVGVGDGPMTMLAEVGSGDVVAGPGPAPRPVPRTTTRFADVLRRRSGDFGTAVVSATTTTTTTTMPTTATEASTAPEAAEVVTRPSVTRTASGPA